MFTLETRVNGHLINIITVLNNGLEDDRGAFAYKVVCRRMDKEPPVIEFSVLHLRNEGIEELSFRVYQKLIEKLREGDYK